MKIEPLLVFHVAFTKSPLKRNYSTDIVEENVTTQANFSAFSLNLLKTKPVEISGISGMSG